VLAADGVAVTDCVVGDFEGSVNGGDPGALNGSATLTHRNTGHYSLALTATDLATVGSFEVVINDTVNACPVKAITVVEEAVYDALFAASSPGYVANAPVNVAQFGGSNGTFAGGIPETKVASIAANAITATAINSDAITAAKVAADVTTEIQSGLATQASVDDLPTNAELATALGTADDAVLVQVALVKAKTDNIPSDPADASDVAASFATVNATLATITGYLDTEIAAILAAVDTEVGAIKTVTDQLAAAQAEPSAVPAANASPLAKIAWLAALARNRVTQTATTQTLLADNGSTPIATAGVSDDGTTFVRSEWA